MSIPLVLDPSQHPALVKRTINNGLCPSAQRSSGDVERSGLQIEFGDPPAGTRLEKTCMPSADRRQRRQRSPATGRRPQRSQQRQRRRWARPRQVQIDLPEIRGCAGILRFVGRHRSWGRYLPQSAVSPQRHLRIKKAWSRYGACLVGVDRRDVGLLPKPLSRLPAGASATILVGRPPMRFRRVAARVGALSRKTLQRAGALIN